MRSGLILLLILLVLPSATAALKATDFIQGVSDVVCSWNGPIEACYPTITLYNPTASSITIDQVKGPQFSMLRDDPSNKIELLKKFSKTTYFNDTICRPYTVPLDVPFDYPNGTRVDSTRFSNCTKVLTAHVEEYTQWVPLSHKEGGKSYKLNISNLVLAPGESILVRGKVSVKPGERNYYNISFNNMEVDPWINSTLFNQTFDGSASDNSYINLTASTMAFIGGVALNNFTEFSSPVAATPVATFIRTNGLAYASTAGYAAAGAIDGSYVYGGGSSWENTGGNVETIFGVNFTEDVCFNRFKVVWRPACSSYCSKQYTFEVVPRGSNSTQALAHRAFLVDYQVAVNRTDGQTLGDETVYNMTTPFCGAGNIRFYVPAGQSNNDGYNSIVEIEVYPLRFTNSSYVSNQFNCTSTINSLRMTTNYKGLVNVTNTTNASNIIHDTNMTWTACDCARANCQTIIPGFEYTVNLTGLTINGTCRSGLRNLSCVIEDYALAVGYPAAPETVAAEYYSPTPANNTGLGSSNNYAYINVSVTTNTSALNVARLNWNGTNETLVINGTSSNGTFWLSINKTGLVDGNYTYSVYLNITGGPFVHLATRQLRVDLSGPVLAYQSPTQPNGTVLNSRFRNDTFVNCSFSEAYNHTAIISWNGTNYTGSSLSAGPGWFGKNLTALTDAGTYTYYCWMNDTSGNSARLTDRVITFAAVAGFTFNYVDEETNTLVINQTETLSIFNLSGNRAPSNVTAFGANITIIDFQAGEYWLVYTAYNVSNNINYVTRSYFLTISNADLVGANQLIELYVLNSSRATLITETIKDENGEELPNAKVKLLRRYVIGSGEIYKVVEMSLSNYVGEAYLNVQLNTPYYKFIVEYNGSVVFESSATQITGSQTIPVTVGADILKNFKFLRTLQYRLNYTNTTYTFLYVFNDASGIARNGCLTVNQLTGQAEVNLCRVCNQSNSASLTCTITNTNGTYLATADIYLDTSNQTYYLVDSLSVTIRDLPSGLGQQGVFAWALFTLGLVVVGLFLSVELGLGLAVLALIIGSATGIYVVSLVAIMGLIVAVGIIWVRLRS